MAFLVDEAFLPATLTVPPMSDDEFAAFVSEHPDLNFEMTAEGELIVMPPTFSVTGFRNQEIGRQLANWAVHDGRGISGDSSIGFVLPNGARRSPDQSWVPRSEFSRLSAKELSRYWHICPAFVIELRSTSDRLRVLRDKMREWIENGAQLGWLIDPESRTVEIYRPHTEPELLTNPTSVAGEGPVGGFVLELQRVWDPMADPMFTGLS
jgi:Uma2 family endonuclease